LAKLWQRRGLLDRWVAAVLVRHTRNICCCGGWLLFAVGTLGTFGTEFDVRCRVPICTVWSGLCEFCRSRQSARLYYVVCAYTTGYSADVVGVCLATRVIAQVVHHPEQGSGFSGAVLQLLFLPSPPCPAQKSACAFERLHQVQVNMVTPGITGFACSRYQAV
jgi:hypothetical protein